MKENIKLLTLEFLLKVYNEDELTVLMNTDEHISPLVNSLILQDFNNSVGSVTPSIKEGVIAYSIGGDYSLSTTELLIRVFP